jgi:hypothetical protein
LRIRRLISRYNYHAIDQLNLTLDGEITKMATSKQQGQAVQKQNNVDAIDVKDDTQTKEEVNPSAPISNWEKIVGFIFGVAFVTALLILSVFIPNPTPSQYSTFQTILALAAAGVGGILAGTIQVKGSIQKWSVRAGGAIALFVIVFFFAPAPPNNINKGDIGYSIEQHEKALKERELSIREDLSKLHLSQTKTLDLEKLRTGTRIIGCWNQIKEPG